MSGHSKWHNIQKTKGAQDAKRAAAFTKISKEMIVAVKEGGGIADPAYNSRLATVITKAKAANMPNDNIKRVLEKAAASGSGDNYETITYEGHGPCGIAVIVETMTDNRNRTAGSVRHHFDKYGGSLGTNGCVSWSFDRKGVIIIDNEDGDYEEDQVMMDAMDCGADDFEAEDDVFTVYTDPDDFNAVADALEGLTTDEAMQKKYGVSGVAPLLFAVGDGNHSLATAKACYEEQKKGKTPEEYLALPSRYALVEVVNNHDDALQFEPIHRVLFGVDHEKFMEEFKKFYPNAHEGKGEGHTIAYTYAGHTGTITVPNPRMQLAVGTLQTFLDPYLKELGGVVERGEFGGGLYSCPRF